MLQLNRVRFRAFEPRDLPALAAMAGDLDLELAAHTRAPGPRPEAEFRARVEAGHPAVATGEPDASEYAVSRTDDPDDRLIGIVGHYDIDLHNRHAEIGVLIGDRASRGLGLGIDAYLLAAIWGLRLRGFHKVYGHVKGSNAAALGTLRRLGLDPSAVLHQHRWVDGAWVDLHIFELLADQWNDRLTDWRDWDAGRLLGDRAPAPPGAATDDAHQTGSIDAG